MKTNFLFPNRFKTAGWIVFIPAAILGFFYLIFDYTPDFLHVQALFIDSESAFSATNNNLIDEISGVFSIIGLLFIAFSKEKTEDEYISRIRVESLVWATYVNYIILLLGIIFVYGFTFFYILIFNMFTILLFFIIRFNWVLYKIRREER
jgi:hypothetical protein